VLRLKQHPERLMTAKFLFKGRPRTSFSMLSGWTIDDAKVRASNLVG